MQITITYIFIIKCDLFVVKRLTKQLWKKIKSGLSKFLDKDDVFLLKAEILLCYVILQKQLTNGSLNLYE